MDDYRKVTGFVLLGCSILLFIILGVVKSNYDSQAGILCDKMHQDPNYNPLTCPIVQDNKITSWYFLAGFAVNSLIFIGGLYFLLKKRIFPESTSPPTEYKANFIDIDLKTLDEEEKSIYLFVKEKGGSVFQGDLIASTGFTKVKISRILDGLENKGVLERKRRGMSNLIVLR